MLGGAGEHVPEAAREALQDAGLAIWTTTAWTLPANLAVAVNDRLQYTLVEAKVCSTISRTCGTPLLEQRCSVQCYALVVHRFWRKGVQHALTWSIGSEDLNNCLSRFSGL